jgi:hypothetical protein
MENALSNTFRLNARAAAAVLALVARRPVAGASYAFLRKVD